MVPSMTPGHPLEQAHIWYLPRSLVIHWSRHTYGTSHDPWSSIGAGTHMVPPTIPGHPSYWRVQYDADLPLLFRGRGGGGGGGVGEILASNIHFIQCSNHTCGILFLIHDLCAPPPPPPPPPRHLSAWHLVMSH